MFDEQRRPDDTVEGGGNGRPSQTASPHDGLEGVLNQQRRDWMSGKRIAAAELLLRSPAVSSDRAAAADLIYHEYLLRAELGESPDWEEYLRDFPVYVDRLRFLRQADQLVAEAFGASDPVEEKARLDDYELEQELGRGGMGVVFKARQKSLNRYVAIKMIRTGEASDKEERKRFENEAQAVARLQHPNIVQIYEVGETDGRPFLALEFVDGRSLARHLDGTPLPARQAAALVETLARAIHSAHENQIIHRDLKPSNVLVAGTLDRCVLKITDFGLAKQLDVLANTRTVGTVGTPSYMAPEQVDVKIGDPDPRTDVYGLGTIMYELLTGRPPFRAESPLQTLKQVAGAERPRPRLLNPAVPRDLETVCLKCLQKEPAQRYGSAAALADDLGRFVKGEPVLARPIGPAARFVRWCRLNPVVASLTAVLLLALLGGMAGIALEWRSAEAARKVALASDVESQELLSELVESNPVVPGLGYRPTAPSIESLLKAETHCRNLLQKNPGEMGLRIALTKVSGSLASLYRERQQWAEVDDSLRQARDLWEPLASEVAGNPVCRDWLATTYTWQGGDNIRSFFQSLLRADAIWEGLAEEQPANLDFTRKIRTCQLRMALLICRQDGRDDCTGLLEEGRTELDRLVHQDSADRASRRRLAFTCYLLGESYQYSSANKALSFWRESYEQRNILAERGHDDLLGDILLAMTCSRLIQGQPADRYYLQAVPLLEQSGRRLDALLKQEPQSAWLRQLRLEGYCCLALCHVKAGQTAKAEQASQDCVKVLTPLDREQIEPMFALEHAGRLIAVAHLLRGAQQPAAALRLARQAAALCSKLAVYPSHNLGFLSVLGGQLNSCSTLANLLGEPVLALEQAELNRRTIEEWIRAAPPDLRHEDALGDAWMRIAKAHWSLGQRDQALAALRESAVIAKRLFERQRSNRVYRAFLSKTYDRLVFYGTQAGDWRGSADAISERTKLWPDNAKQLAKSADDFAVLAQRVTARARGPLSREDQAERDHDLAESRRVRQAAEAASGRADHDLRAER